MAKDVIITPANGLIDFKDTNGVTDAIIQLDDLGNLNITNSAGVLSIGNTAANLYIGDGTNSVDVIFEQSGKIRALTNKTLTLGQSDSFVTTASPFGFLSPDGTKQITARMLNTDVLSFQGNAGELLSLSDSMTGTIFSVNDVSGIPSIEVLDTGTIKLAEYGGNVGIGTSSPGSKLHVEGATNSTYMTVGGPNRTLQFSCSANGINDNAIHRIKVGSTVGAFVFGNLNNDFMYITSAGNVGIGASSPTTKLETYVTTNDLQIISSVRNDNAGSGVAAIGFNVSSSAAGDTSAIKAGIGLVRQNVQGVGQLNFYNRSTTDTSSFTSSDIKGAISQTGVWSLGSAPGAESLRVTPVASSVNFFSVQGGATGIGVTLTSADSADANVYNVYSTKGNGVHYFQTGSGSLNQFIVGHTASAVNQIQVSGGTTGSGVTLSAVGSDANINLVLSPKDSGGVCIGTTVDRSRKLTVTGNVGFNIPSDSWLAAGLMPVSSATSGILYSHGSFRASWTCNGYRNTSTQWTSLSINSSTGAAMIEQDPTGFISFHTNASKATGSGPAVTERVRINDTGVGIGTTAPSAPLHIFGTVYPLARIERSTTVTNGMRSTFQAVHRTSGDMVDGFGADVSFVIQDSAGVDNEIANFGAIRDGADNSGALVFSTVDAGVGQSTTKAILKANGNFGIGLTNPSSKLQVNGTVTATAFAGPLTGNATTATTLQTARSINGVSFNGSANIAIRGFSGSGNDFSTAGLEVIGNGATNTVFPSVGFHQPGVFAASIQLRGGTDFRLFAQGGVNLANLTCNIVLPAAGSVSAPALSTSGDTDTGIYFPSANTIAITTGGTVAVTIDVSGNFTATGNVTAYSDERLKTDWQPLLPTFLYDIAKIKSGTFTRIDTKEKQAGVSAQDVQKILPEVVINSSETLSLAYGNLAMVTIVELTKKVLELENKINELLEKK